MSEETNPVPSAERAEPSWESAMRGRFLNVTRWQRWGCAGLFVAASVAGGCKSRTETGYAPRKLGDSLTVQKGYYAAPFSPEEREAAAGRNEVNKDRRPDVSGGPGRY